MYADLQWKKFLQWDSGSAEDINVQYREKSSAACTKQTDMRTDILKTVPLLCYRLYTIQGFQEKISVICLCTFTQ